MVKSDHKQGGTKVIVDGGATKMELILKMSETDLRLRLDGFSPLHCGENEMQLAIIGLRAAVMKHTSDVAQIEYYGSGCADSRICEGVKSMIANEFPRANVIVGSDMELAAKALFGKDSGVACILGTGANTMYWDGCRGKNLVPSLGYILGDEGSGAAMGKRLLQLYLRGKLSDELSKSVANEVSYKNRGEVYAHLYEKRENASQYLAGIMKIFSRGNEFYEEIIDKCVIPSLKEFFQNMLVPYKKLSRRMSVCGSIASVFEKEFRLLGAYEGWEIDKIVKTPLDAL